jgi:hypothetical protein
MVLHTRRHLGDTLFPVRDDGLKGTDFRDIGSH